MRSGRPIIVLFILACAAGCATTTAPSGSTEVSAELRPGHFAERDGLSAETRAQQLFIRGMTQAHIGNHEAALDLYREALMAVPNTAAIMSAAGESYAAVGDETSAIYNVRRASELVPDNPHYHFQLAQLYLSAGDEGAAAGVYEKILKRKPGDLDALYELARVRTISGDYSGAIETYELLLDEVGDDRDIQEEILQLYTRTGDRAGIERVLKSMLDDEPEDADLHRDLGELYLELDRPREAAEQFEEALKINPSDVDVLLSLTDIYRSEGNATRADLLMERAANVEATTPEELVAQAAPLYARSVDDPEARETAIQILTRVLAMDARNAEALVMLGDIRLGEGNYEEAGDLLYRAVDVNPRDPQLWVQASGAFLQAGNRRKAVDVADEGLLLFPGFLPLLRLSGFALMDSFQNTEAIQRFEEAVAIIREDRTEAETDLADLLGALGLLYTRTRDAEASDAAYQEALEIDPNNASVLNNWAYTLAEQGRELNRALDMARRAVDLAPGTASFLDTYGWIHFKKGDYQGALRLLRRATEADSASAAVYEHLGDAYKALGDGAGADQAWKTALQMNPGNDALKQKLGRD